MTDTRNMTAENNLSLWMRGAGNAYVSSSSATIWDAEGASNYTFKLLPSIDTISHSSGYTNGNQVLTIAGKAFDGDVVTVTVDGVTCDLISVTKYEIKCRTRPKTDDTAASSYYVGQHGWRRYLFDGNRNTGHNDWRNYVDSTRLT